MSIFPITIYPSNLESQNQAKENSRGSPEFPNQNLRQIGQRVHELWSDIQTNKQRLELNIEANVCQCKVCSHESWSPTRTFSYLNIFFYQNLSKSSLFLKALSLKSPKKVTVWQNCYFSVGLQTFKNGEKWKKGGY